MINGAPLWLAGDLEMINLAYGQLGPCDATEPQIVLEPMRDWLQAGHTFEEFARLGIELVSRTAYLLNGGDPMQPIQVDRDVVLMNAAGKPFVIGRAIVMAAEYTGYLSHGNPMAMPILAAAAQDPEGTLGTFVGALCQNLQWAHINAHRDHGRCQWGHLRPRLN